MLKWFGPVWGHQVHSRGLEERAALSRRIYNMVRFQPKQTKGAIICCQMILYLHRIDRDFRRKQGKNFLWPLWGGGPSGGIWDETLRRKPNLESRHSWRTHWARMKPFAPRANPHTPLAGVTLYPPLAGTTLPLGSAHECRQRPPADQGQVHPKPTTSIVS